MTRPRQRGRTFTTPTSRDETGAIVGRMLTWVEARTEPLGEPLAEPGAGPMAEVTGRAGTRAAEPGADPVSLA
ncbi:hypothetical protein [Streptomyces sp. enrichment culture]|uniref:hypothetical protein n=1 Tax=Streptomyces sp. enrichment culture TaxID=1795815 RepID=UPI003F54FF28